MAERIPNGVAKLVVFKAYLSSDHVSVATGKTIAITISKNGATSFSNPAAGATNATEMASGFYKFTLGTGDTDTNGPLAWRGAVATVDDVGDVCEVVAATNAGFTGIPAAVAGASGGLLISGSNTGTTTLGALTVTGATTFTGAVTGTSGSNDLRVNGAVPGATGGLFIAGTNAATTITTGLTTTFTGNLTGSVASVTGAVGSVTGNVGGNVAGSVGSVSAGVNTVQLAGQTVTAAAGVTFPSSVASPTNITAGTITTVTNLTNAPSAGDFTATMKTSINAEIVDCLATDTYAEPAQGAPAATASLATKIGMLHKAWRNKSTQTSAQYSLYNDDAATVDHKASVSSDGTTLTRGEISTGP